MNDKILSFLGLCRRAKKMVIGAEVVTESINSGNALLVLYADDFSQNSLKPVAAAAAAKGVPVLRLNRSKESVSRALGRLCGVLAVEDKGFADKLTQMILQEQ